MAAEAVTSLVSSIRNLPASMGVTFPSIVFIGDQSSGKSMLLESIVGVNIPGLGEQKVPLLIRIQDHADPQQPEITLRYEDKSVTITSEKGILEEVDRAKTELTGDNEITLVVKRKGSPDLFIVDLPEICTETTQDMNDSLMKYMKPKESIIINVISSGSPSSTSTSTKVTKLADPAGQRTMLVVTCTNTTDNINEEVSTQGSKNLGHYYVRKRLINESCEEAEVQETELFTTNAQLSQIDESVVGVDRLVKKLVNLHTIMLYEWFPIVSNAIDQRIITSVSELDKLPKNLVGVSGFMLYVVASMETLRNRLIRWDSNEYRIFLVEQLNEFLQQLQDKFKVTGKFLQEEVDMINQMTGPSDEKLIFRLLMEKKLSSIAGDMEAFATNIIFESLKSLTQAVMIDRFQGYHQDLIQLVTKAADRSISIMKVKYCSEVVKMIECEKQTVWTSEPGSIVSLDKLKVNQANFSSALKSKSMKMEMEGHSKIELKHLHDISDKKRNQAFELKMKSTAYTNVVIKRVVDEAALSLRLMIENLVTGDMLKQMVNTIVSRGDDIDHLFQTSPSVNVTREKIENDIAVLLGTKKHITKAMDTPVTDMEV